jgi:hypothetical protein
MLSIPDKAGQARELAFIDDWKQRLGKRSTPASCRPSQRTDLALLINKLKATAGA